MKRALSPRRRRRAFLMAITRSPLPKIRTIAFNPPRYDPSARIPTAASSGPLTAVLSNFHSAWTMTATTTGLMPWQPHRLGGSAVTRIGPCQRQHDEHGRQDEADPARDEPFPAGPLVSEINGHLGRAWPRNKVGCSQEIHEAIFPLPIAAAGTSRRASSRYGPPGRQRQSCRASEKHLPLHGRSPLRSGGLCAA